MAIAGVFAAGIARVIIACSAFGGSDVSADDGSAPMTDAADATTVDASGPPSCRGSPANAERPLR